MKLNPFYFMVTLLLTAIFTYAATIYSLNNFKTLYTIFGAGTTMVYLLFLMGIIYDNGRKGVNIKTVSSLFLLIDVSLLYYFSFENRTESAYIIINSLFLLLFLALVNGIFRAKT